MKSNNKLKVITSLIIGIVSMLILIVGATYSYFAANTINNFNTAFISYSVPERTTAVILNGTSATLYLDIEGKDMIKRDYDVTYYGSSTGKTKIKTQESLGVGIVINSEDTNTYACSYVLNITHSGINDMYNRFNNQYANKSDGQIVLTVNGIDYDFNDTFPNTISGSFYTSYAEPGYIDVGIRFVNINDLNQSYLANTDISLNFTVTSFQCTIGGYTYLSYFPKSFEWDDDYIISHVFDNNLQNSKQFDDYDDLINSSYYSLVYDDTQSNIYALNSFSSISNCQMFLSKISNNSSLTCKYLDNAYRISYDNDYYYSTYVKMYSYDLSECQDTLDTYFLSDQVNISYYDENDDDWYNTTLYSNNGSITCEEVEVTIPIFVRSKANYFVSDKDEWNVYYSTTFFQDREQCELLPMANNIYFSNLNIPNLSYCEQHNGYYHKREPLIVSTRPYYYYDDSYEDAYISQKKYTSSFELASFDNETDCLNFLNNTYWYDINEYSNYDNYSSSYPECVLSHSVGDTYAKITSEICVYDDDTLVCAPIEEDGFFDYDFDSYINTLKSLDFECISDANRYYCNKDGTRITYNIYSPLNSTGSVQIEYYDSDSMVRCYYKDEDSYDNYRGLFCDLTLR